MRVRSWTLEDKYDNCGKQHCVSIPVYDMSVRAKVLGSKCKELTLKHEMTVFCGSS